MCELRHSSLRFFKDYSKYARMTMLVTEEARSVENTFEHTLVLNIIVVMVYIGMLVSLYCDVTSCSGYFFV